MVYTITGSVVLVQPEQRPSEKFRYRNLILLQDGRFPQEICIQFHNSHVDLLSGITPKAGVIVKFELRGKRDQNKEVWYNQLVGFDISKTV